MSGVAYALQEAVSLHETAQRVYAVHGDITEAAVEALVERLQGQDRLDELQAWGARELLNKARLQINHATYATAHGQRSQFAVEEPPSGYRSPTSAHLVPAPSLAGGEGFRVPKAALRTLLKLQLRLGSGRAVVVECMLKADVLRAAAQLEAQGRGCLENAELLRLMAQQMREGERARDTVRRLERE